jgi:hypothetical protein
MNQEFSQSDSKKPYEPPQLVTISLRPEEAVLGHCKNASGGGPTPGCGIILGGCQTLGS